MQDMFGWVQPCSILGATWLASWRGHGGLLQVTSCASQLVGRVLLGPPAAESIQQLALPVVAAGTTKESVSEVVAQLASGDASVGAGTDSTLPKSAVDRPFILSEGLPPVPHKLAARILRGEYVDMAELLCDNLEAQRQAAATTSSTSSTTPKGRREVPDILSWVQCFGTYMVVIMSKFPHRIKELLAYQTLIMREACRCGGKGWMTYDSLSPASGW